MTKEMLIRDIMSKPVTIAKSAPITEALDKMQERIRLAEMEFVKLQETVLSRLEQMQLYRQSNGQNKGIPN